MWQRWQTACSTCAMIGSLKIILFTAVALLATGMSSAPASSGPVTGFASWYGEEHRGKLMANGEPFDPDRLTAASWFYPLGTKVRVTLTSASGTMRSVTVTISDRGPERRLVLGGRVIDLARAAFERLARLQAGLVRVTVQRTE